MYLTKFLMGTGDMLQWYHHVVYNRYWRQYWMIKDWVNHRRNSHQAARHMAFYETTQISQNLHRCACRHDFTHHRTFHETRQILQNQHCCACRHYLNHHRAFHETAQISQNQHYFMCRNDFNRHSCHHRNTGFFHSLPEQHEQSMRSLCDYPKHRKRNLTALQSQPEISPNRPIQNSLKCEDDKSPVVEHLQENSELRNLDSEFEFIVTDQWIRMVTESQKFRQKRDALKKQRSNGGKSSGAVRLIIEERRKWIFTEYGEKYLKNPECEHGLDFTVMTYNVLSQQNLELNPRLYSHCDDYVLDWSYRAPNLLREVEKHNVDVICLQEIEKEHYENTFKPHFESLGYNSIFKKKTGNQNDGCAIFFKAQMFSLEAYVAVEFRNREAYVLDRDNVGLIAVLKPKSTEEDVKLCVATTHLVFNSKRGDVKLSQLRVLLAEMDKLAFKQYSESSYPVYHPIILCGDMNSEPFSPLYKFLTCRLINFKDMKSGSVSGQAGAFNKGRLMTMDDLNLSPLGINEESYYKQLDENRYKKWLSVSSEASVENVAPGSFDEISAEVQSNSLSSDTIGQPGTSTVPMRHKKNEVDSFSHRLELMSSYKHFKLDGTREATIENCGSSGNVDYIFYSAKYKHSLVNQGMPKHESVNEGSLKLLGYYGLLGAKDLEDIGGLPNSHLSSDHTCLISRFLFKF